jgi:hypothetical protein
MRTVLKLAFSLLIWPILVMAQDPPPSAQLGPAQSPAGAQGFLPAPSTTMDASPTPVVPVPAKTHALVHLRPISQTTAAAGYAPTFKVSAGYSVISLGMPSSGRAALGGMNAGISVDSNRRFGAKLDLGYAHASNVFSTGHGMSVLSYLVGPVFYPSEGTSLRTHVHLLLGGARVAGPFANANGRLNIGQVHYPAWALGGGAEYRLSPAFGFRLGVDYLHTHFFNSSGAVHGQQDIRVVNSIVYYPGMPTFRRRR